AQLGARTSGERLERRLSACLDDLRALGERVRERRDARVDELLADRLEFDARLRELRERALRAFEVVGEAGADLAVIEERVERGLRDGVHGVRADELLDVVDVAPRWVLPARARPEDALGPRAPGGEAPPALAREELAEACVGELRVRDRRATAQLARCGEARVDRRVDAAHEEARDRRDPGERLVPLHAALEPLHESERD